MSEITNTFTCNKCNDTGVYQVIYTICSSCGNNYLVYPITKDLKYVTSSEDLSSEDEYKDPLQHRIKFICPGCGITYRGPIDKLISDDRKNTCEFDIRFKLCLCKKDKVLNFNFKKSLVKLNVPKKHKYIDPNFYSEIKGNSDYPAINKNLIKYIQTLRENVSDFEDYKILYLEGGPKSGKTVLSLLSARWFMARNKKILFIENNKFLKEYGNFDNTTDLSKYDLIIIDNFLSSFLESTENSVILKRFFYSIKEALDNEVKFIINSTVPVKDIKKGDKSRELLYNIIIDEINPKTPPVYGRLEKELIISYKNKVINGEK